MKNNIQTHPQQKRVWLHFTQLFGISLGTLITACAAWAATPTLSLAPIPLVAKTIASPQVVLAVANSESMDGNLSGAIMTGSGYLSTALNSLYNSSSPQNYTVPAGFTAPVTGTAAGGSAVYTATAGGGLEDNSYSRLNVAKAGITAILNAYMANTQFALEDYSISSPSLYTTWVYYMSPTATGPFVFTNTQTSGNEYVNNPCYNYSSASTTVSSDCKNIAKNTTLAYGSTTLSTNKYIQVGASSDDAAVNDVLYASGLPSVFVTYNPDATSHTSTLSSYEAGNAFSEYHNTTIPSTSWKTYPTNAGYIPTSYQVMYAERGFAYYAQPTGNSGNIAVSMTNAGSTPTTSSVATAIANFTPYLQPETNDPTTTEIKSLAVQSPIAGLMTEALSYLQGLPTSASCTPKQYVVMVTDGQPTMDLQGNNWPPLGSVAATFYKTKVTATFNSDGSLASTNDQALTDAISALSNLNTAGIKTYIIGVGAGADPAANPTAAATLTAMAIAGGTANYFPATNPASLGTDFNSIMLSIQNGTYATTASPVSSVNLTTGTVEFQASFVSSDTPYLDWTGNITAEVLNSATGLPTGTVNWYASKQLDALDGITNTSSTVTGTGSGYTSRIIATWNPSLNAGAGGGAPFEWSTSDLSTTQQAELQPSDSYGQLRLNYLHGDASQEARNTPTTGPVLRNRSHILGDIVNSQIAYVAAPNGPYTTASYSAFVTAESSRTPILYVGANDGMLHAFNASTGNESFAFIPNAVFANLINLTAPLYNNSHQYFVDGSPTSGDVQFSDGTWHTLLAGGENAGGQSIYALDITNPGTITTEALLATQVLWEFTDADMGYSYSQPFIAPTAQALSAGSLASQSYAIFFGNGYNSPNNNAVLYAVNPKTGAQIAKINLCTAVPTACSSTAAEGLSSVTAANAYGLLGVPVTTVYAGDLQGNLWAIDVSDPNPSNWASHVRQLFIARDSSGNPQPITTAPAVTLNPNYPSQPGLLVMFATGQLLQTSDLSSTQTQTAYGVWDDTASTVSYPYTRANLQAQTLTNSTLNGQPILTDTNTAINWSIYLGWYDDFPTPGQEVVSNPSIFDMLFNATLNTPPGGVCGGAFSAESLDLNYATGGASSASISTSTLGPTVVGQFLGNGYVSSGTTVFLSNGAPALLFNLSSAAGASSLAITLSPNIGSAMTTCNAPSVNCTSGSTPPVWWQLQ